MNIHPWGRALALECRGLSGVSALACDTDGIDGTEDNAGAFMSADTMECARELGISRMQQDAFALKSHMRAGSAREARRFVGEILPLRAEREEASDQSAVEPDMADLERLTPFVPPDGTLTPGNTRAMHDGAAMVLVVSQKVWSDLGKAGFGELHGGNLACGELARRFCDSELVEAIHLFGLFCARRYRPPPAWGTRLEAPLLYPKADRQPRAAHPHA